MGSFRLLIAMALAFGSIFSVCSASAAETDSNIIKIGEVGSMTGSEATFGESTHKGVQFAVDEANKAGGIKGKQIKVITLDNQSREDETAIAVTKLITQEKVVAIIGEVASKRSLTMGPIAQQYKIPMISPASTNPKVTEIGDYIFRVCFIDPFQGYVMAKFTRENLKLSKVAILRDVKNDYSVGLADVFSATFKKMGGQIIEDKSYSANDFDFKSQLTAIGAKKPEAIFVPGYYNDVGLIARQARELGIKVPFLGGDGWESPKLKEIGGNNLNGSYFSNHYSTEDKSPHVQNFIANFKKVYGEVPDGLAAMGYDAAKVLIKSLAEAKDETSKSLRDAIAATKNFQGVTGLITIDEKRNASKPAVVLMVDKGGYKYQTTITP